MDLDPGLEESRLRRSIESVEKLLGTTLTGEAVLFGSFTSMDGYARFEKGEHRVFLGVDENHGPGSYLDILITHELTHVARESVPEVWEGFGLNPKMTHDEFVENMPVIEHLMSEGFSCVVSELLNPKEDPWNYAYQTEHSLPQILLHGPAVDHAVHAQLAKGKGEYHELYDVENYTPVLPRYAHYVWAWQWVKHLLKEIGKGDPKKLLGICSKELQNDALEFKLPKILL